MVQLKFESIANPVLLSILPEPLQPKPRDFPTEQEPKNIRRLTHVTIHSFVSYQLLPTMQLSKSHPA